MRWLRRGAIAALIFAACWIGAVSYWRATNRMPATGDVALYFVALPLALLFGLLLLRSLARRLPALSGGAPATSTAATGATAATAPERAPALAIMGAALRLPHADSGADLAAALADGSARPALDPELVDDDGYPVMTARTAAPPEPAFLAACQEWFGAHAIHDIDPGPAQWRALGMASAVVAEVAEAAAAMYAIGDAGSEAGSEADRGTPTLRLIALLPGAWPAALQAAAAQWLGHVAAQAGWPAGSIRIDAAAATAATGLPAPLPSLLQRLAEDAATAPSITLVVACDSHLAQADVDDWSGAGVLFTARHPKGLIPGEAAAALLLTDPAGAARAGGARSTMLHAPAVGRLEQSADSARRVDAAPLSALACQAIARAGLAADDIALVLADSGQRVSRVLELAGALGAALPQLDAGDDLLHLGAASGACGLAPLLATLALAHQQALERGAPVLCLGNEDPFYRCAAVVGPVAFAPPSISSESAR